MKMRKILSFVLVLSLVLGSFSMAFAATPATGLSDIAGIANEDAIQVNADLGIITGFPDGTFLPEKSVTRAEFAAMITRALAIPDSALAGYSATSFKDMSGYGWATGYIGFCASKGIMLGDGQGNAMPGRTINVNEAMTMVLRAIGYVNHSAELVGTWPANYVTVAQNVGLYDDVAATMTVDRANAAQIIYNALTVQKVAVNADGETRYLTTGTGNSIKEVNLLNSGLGASIADAKVILGTESSSLNLTPYTGACVVPYVKDNKIVALGEIKSTFLTGSYTSSTGILKVGSVEYKLADTTKFGEDLDTDIMGYTFDNAAPTQRSLVTTIGGLFPAKTDITVAVKLDNKTVTKLYSAAEWDYAPNDGQFKSADIKALADNEIFGVDFVLDDDDEIDSKTFALVGVSALDKIAVDNVVYVYAYGTGHTNAGKIAKVAVGTEVVTGKVTKIASDKYTVNGAEYEFSAAFTGTLPEAGDDVKLFLDAYGDVYDFESTADKADNYAVSLATSASTDVAGAQVRVYDANADAEKTFAVKTSTTLPAAPTVGALFGYSLNKDGKIDSITTATTTAFTTAKVISTQVVDLGGKTYPVANDAVVFAKTSTGYEMTSMAKLQTTGNLTQTNVSVSAIFDSGKVVALRVDKADATKSGDDTYAVINSFDQVYDAVQDDKAMNLVGFANGAAYNKNSNSGTTAVTGFANYATSAALFKVVEDADGYISTIAVTNAATNADGNKIHAVANDNFTVQTVDAAGTWFTIDKDAVVYYAADNGTSDLKFSLSSVNGFRASSTAVTYQIWLYDTDDDTVGYDVVIFTKI